MHDFRTHTSPRRRAPLKAASPRAYPLASSANTSSSPTDQLSREPARSEPVTGVTAKVGLLYDSGYQYRNRRRTPDRRRSNTLSTQAACTEAPPRSPERTPNELEERPQSNLLLHAASPVKPPKIKLFSFTRMRTTVFTIASQALGGACPPEHTRREIWLETQTRHAGARTHSASTLIQPERPLREAKAVITVLTL